MDHLSNWIEIPVFDMERAKKIYTVLLDVGMKEMGMAGNDCALISGLPFCLSASHLVTSQRGGRGRQNMTD